MSPTCETLDNFYADVSVSDKQLYKFTRRVTKFSKLSTNFPMLALAKRVRLLLKQCKKQNKAAVTTGTRLLSMMGDLTEVSTNVSSAYVVWPMMLGSMSGRHADHGGTTILVHGSAKEKKDGENNRRKKKKKKKTVEQKQQALQRTCVSLQKRKAQMGIDDYVENVVYEAYLLGKLPSQNIKAPRTLSDITESIATSSILTKLDLYDAVNEMLLSVPSHSGTCAKLCPCSVVNRKQKVCNRPLVRSRGGDGGRCVEVDDPAFIPGNDQKKNDKSGQRKETRCPTVSVQQAAQSTKGRCGSDTPPWKIGFAFFQGTFNQAACAHFTLGYYCEPDNQLACAGGRKSQKECCKTKCSQRMCEARRRLFETFGVVNLYDSGKCLLRGLAADVSFSVFSQQRHCREVCEKTFGN